MKRDIWFQHECICVSMFASVWLRQLCLHHYVCVSVDCVRKFTSLLLLQYVCITMVCVRKFTSLWLLQYVCVTMFTSLWLLQNVCVRKFTSLCLLQCEIVDRSNISLWEVMWQWVKMRCWKSSATLWDVMRQWKEYVTETSCVKKNQASWWHLAMTLKSPVYLSETRLTINIIFIMNLLCIVHPKCLGRIWR